MGTEKYLTLQEFTNPFVFVHVVKPQHPLAHTFLQFVFYITWKIK